MDLNLGDCMDPIKGMATIPNESIDCIICDMPYNCTNFKWDLMLDLEAVFKEYLRVIKPNGAIVLFSQQPFTTDLMIVGRKYYRSEIIYQKSRAANFLQSKIKPLKIHENILIFAKKSPTYNPQMTEGTPYQKKGGGMKPANHLKDGVKNLAMDNKGVRFPKSIIQFKQESGQHGTQKPVSLCEWLINTYSNENDLVLDNCMGSGTTAVACLNTNRRFIGWEMEKNIYEKACKRVEEAMSLKK